jgi:hypothetical protein
MEVYANGFAVHQGSYFISHESASGVMTGWRTYGNTKRQGFLPECEGFFIETVFVVPG